MTASSPLPAPNLMPLMRYRELAEAMSWLETAFGFEKQIAVTDSDGAVIYGQMTYRGSLIMMGAVRDTDLDKLMCQPDEVGGVETQSCYLVVDDADAHYARACKSGADVVLDIKSDGLGRRGYSCRDPEGHIWNFGTYNPGRGLSTAAVAAAPASPPEAEPTRKPRYLMSLAAVLAIGAAGWWFAGSIKTEVAERIAASTERTSAAEARTAYAELAKVRAEKLKADELAIKLGRDLDAERARNKSLAINSDTASRQIAEAQSAREAAEAATATLRDQIKREQAALHAAIEAKRVAEEKLAVLSASREAAFKPDTVTSTAAAKAAPEAPTITAPAQSKMPAETGKIETAATGPASPSPASEEATEIARPERPVSRPSRSKNRSVARSKPLPPTYLVDLKDVPWPHSTWYK